MSHAGVLQRWQATIADAWMRDGKLRLLTSTEQRARARRQADASYFTFLVVHGWSIELHGHEIHTTRDGELTVHLFPSEQQARELLERVEDLYVEFIRRG